MSDGSILVNSARSRVRRAVEEWNPTDHDAMRCSQEQLEQAVHDLRHLERLPRAGSADVVELRTSLLKLKSEIADATRTLDASAAFYRGLAVRLGRAMSGYDAAGRMPSIDEPVVACEVHG